MPVEYTLLIMSNYDISQHERVSAVSFLSLFLAVKNIFSNGSLGINICADEVVTISSY